ncbi:hypothetical protein Tco_1249818 [Tanacetum coccineum]
MSTTNQGMSFAKLEQIVAHRVANAIETIAIYETKTRMARESMSQIKQQEDKMAKNDSNKRKWESAHGHYKSDCPMWMFQNCVNKYWKEKALGDLSVVENDVDV